MRVKRKEIYLKLLNRFLKENNIYYSFWHSLKSPLSMEFYFRNLKLKKIINNGSKRDFQCAFSKLPNGYHERKFWSNFNDKWICLFNNFYEEKYNKKKK